MKHYFLFNYSFAKKVK